MPELELLILVAGLGGLYLGSELLVAGAEALADRFRLSDVIFGMLVLAIGTDLPEIFVAVDASVRSLAGEDLSGIVIGSAIGSSIGQFALVFGVTGFMGFAARPRRLGLRNSAFLLGSLVALFMFSLDGTMQRWEGLVLVGAYAAYLASMILRSPPSSLSSDTEIAVSMPKAWLKLAGGLVVLLVSAELTVVSAIRFGDAVGLSHIAVSAIIIGLGSSLPELSVSVVALIRKRGGLSIGNLMGSNVLDSLLVPGLAAVISPLAIPMAILAIDLPVLTLATVMVLTFIYWTDRGIHRLEASALLTLYCGYVVLRLVGPGS